MSLPVTRLHKKFIGITLLVVLQYWLFFSCSGVLLWWIIITFQSYAAGKLVLLTLPVDFLRFVCFGYCVVVFCRTHFCDERNVFSKLCQSKTFRSILRTLPAVENPHSMSNSSASKSLCGSVVYSPQIRGEWRRICGMLILLRNPITSGQSCHDGSRPPRRALLQSDCPVLWSQPARSCTRKPVNKTTLGQANRSCYELWSPIA